MEEKTKDQKPEDEIFVEAITEVVSSSFESISFTDSNASDFYSTDQISEIIDTHFGKKVPRSCITAALEALCYRSRLMGDKYYWLMRKKIVL